MYYNNFNHRKESLAVANYAMKLGLRWETVACWWRVGGVLVAGGSLLAVFYVRSEVVLLCWTANRLKPSWVRIRDVPGASVVAFSSMTVASENFLARI
jgi:hypothetical protein